MYLRKCNIICLYFLHKNITTHHFKRKIIKYLSNIIVHIKIKYT